MNRTILADRRLLSALILAMLISWSVCLATPASAEATYTSEMARTYASYVSSAEPDSNYHQPMPDYVTVANSANASVGARIVYLMFNFQGITSRTGIIINSAQLRVRTVIVTEPHKIGVHYCEDNSWRGYSITWNNKPPFLDEAVETIAVAKEAMLYNWTVTSCVKTAFQGGWLSLVLKCEDPVPHGNHWIKFYSIPTLAITWTRLISRLSYQPIMPTPDEDVLVTCSVTNASGVGEVSLFYRVDGGELISRPMVQAGGSNYTATIPGQIDGARVSFYVEIVDIFQNRAAWDTVSYQVSGQLRWWLIPSWVRALSAFAVIGFFGYQFTMKRRSPTRPQPASPPNLSLTKSLPAAAFGRFWRQLEWT